MSRKTFVFLLIIVLIVNSTGLFNDIFTGDSALYACISKTFSQSGDYINIFVNGNDWLDKPHFPFWICAFSMDIFGINTFAYKLPSILFFIIGLFYTYKLAKNLYNIETAYLSTLLFASSLHILISNNDTRAEAILVGLIMGGVYYMYRLTFNFSVRNILLTSLFSAAAIMTKGLFVLIILYSAIFGYMLLKKEFKKLLNYKWLIVLILTILFITPELYAVYKQFDLHPEKIIFDRQGVSGIKFFFWDSQLGRFFNTCPIKGKGDIFFFVHTLLWGFAPWAIIGFGALLITARNLYKKIETTEYLTFFGFTIMFLFFSLSSFQLPHYLNIIFPFLAIRVAALVIENVNDFKFNLLTKISVYLYAIVYILLIGLLEYFFRPDNPIIGILLIIALLSLTILSIFSKFKNKFVINGIISMMLFILYMNLSFYPTLLKYQAGAQVAYYSNQNYPDYDIITTNFDSLLQYYSKNKVEPVSTIAMLTKYNNRKVLLFTDNDFMTLLKENNKNYTILKSFDDFHITILNSNFINYKTREKATKKYYLIKIDNIQ